MRALDIPQEMTLMWALDIPQEMTLSFSFRSCHRLARTRRQGSMGLCDRPKRCPHVLVALLRYQSLQELFRTAPGHVASGKVTSLPSSQAPSLLGSYEHPPCKPGLSLVQPVPGAPHVPLRRLEARVCQRETLFTGLNFIHSFILKTGSCSVA